MFTQHKLKNGIRVICSPQKETKAATVMVLVKVGSRQETPKNNGISHFLEHLMFKGTVRRPHTQIISQELDAVGADYNAWTSKDHTGYYVKVASAHLPLAVDMLADMLTASIFNPEEVERERGTILEEINMYEDNPMAKIDDFFEESLFGKNNALGRHIIGTPELIRSISQKNIVDYWKAHYHAGNMVISIAGNIDKKKTLRLLENLFAQVSRGAQNKSGKAALPAKKSFSAHVKKTSQAHLMLGFPGVSYTHADTYSMGLLGIILGGNMSSRLFIQVRERLGLCYFIRAGADSYEDTGSFAIQAGLDLKKLDNALVAISKEIKDIKQNGAREEELTRAKEYMKGKMALSLEDSSDVASFLGKQVLWQKSVLTTDQVFKKLSAIKPRDIKNTAQKYLDAKKMHLVTLSPFKDTKQFGKYIDF